MSTTVQQIIEAGSARSIANDLGKIAIDGELVNQLNRKYQSMLARMALASRDNTLARTTVTFTGSPPTAALPTDIINISRLELANGTKVNLVPSHEKDRTWHLASQSVVYRQGNSLVSRGGSADPANGTVVTMLYNDAPAALTGLSSTLDARFPVRFENCLILDQAVYMSVKDKDRSPLEYQALKAELNEENALFLALTKNSNTATETPHAATPSQSA